ncbi:MAG: hypothetical protein U0694_18455 [Anaerolineae bacterium]
MSQNQIDYKALRRRVEEGVKKEKNAARGVLFAISASILVMLIALGWGIAGDAGILRDDAGLAVVAILTIATFVSVLFHGITLSMDTRSGDASIRERLMKRELSEEMLRMGLDEDVEEKRKRTMRLSEDGELEEIVDESPSDVVIDEEQPRQRGLES